MSLSRDVNGVSNIQTFFAGKSIFVTGATGSLGKLLVEKLLRSCLVERIYILVREKKGKEAHERVKELFDVPAFEPLKKQMPNFTDKITVCIGDCLEPNLGLCQADLDVLKNNVHCVLHSAATIQFNAQLRKATYINVRATQDLLRIAKEMKKLTSFVYISTGYSHCPRSDIDEIFYDPPMVPQKLMNLVESLNDDVLDAITPTVLKEWPNSYVFTKAVAEDVIKTEGKGLPLTIVRPTMIFNCYKEPIPGWLDNFYGTIGMGVGTAMGLIRTIFCEKKKLADVVPADYVVNATLAAASKQGKRTAREDTDYISTDDERAPIIYNFSTGCQKPLKMETLMDLLYKHSNNIPTTLAIWYPVTIAVNNIYLYALFDFFLHLIPAYVLDCILFCLGRRLIAVDGYQKLRKALDVFQYFGIREWNIRNTNVLKMWNELNAKDRELFDFDVKLLDWDDFIRVACLGARIFALKDPLDTIPKAKRRMFFFKIAHYGLITALGFMLYFLVKLLFRIVF